MPAPVKISACCIVRDEEFFLPGLLESISGIFDDVVIVDTGSRDRTIEIAEAWGPARIGSFQWRDDFSAARNYAASLCRGDWIMHLDADERLLAGNGPLLREMLGKALEPDLLALTVWCYSPALDGSFLWPIKIVAPTGRDQTLRHPAMRIHRNLPGLDFEGRCHESLDAAIERLGGRAMHSCIGILHEGYRANKTAARQKLERNLAILEAEETANPADATGLLHFNLGRTLAGLGEDRRAADHFEQALALADGANWRPFCAEDLALLRAKETRAAERLSTIKAVIEESCSRSL